MKILIIEDEIELLISVGNYLTKENYICELAESFSKALQKASIYEYDVILLDITLPAGAAQSISIMKNHLKAVAKNVVWLNLSHNNCTDASLDFLPLMTNLEKLRLEKNPLTDGIVNQIAGLQHLEALNLNETGITAAGLEKLKSVASLKRIYSWKGEGK